MSMHAELVLDAKATLGEGPLWDSQKQVLYWIDIDGNCIHLFSPESSQDRVINIDQKVGCLALRQDGGLILGLEHGIGLLELVSEKLTIKADPEEDLPRNRFNDGKCDPVGRFWAGTMNMDSEQGAGNLYCVYPDFRIEKKLEGVTVSNGLAWSMDQTVLYYIDTPTRSVSAFDYSLESGAISNRRTVIRVPESLGYPDGMSIDEEGMLWIAMYWGGRVTRWNPVDGRMVSEVSVPAPEVSSCVFGGADYQDLYITTARSISDEGEIKEYPHAGGLFKITPGVKGTPLPRFAG